MSRGTPILVLRSSTRSLQSTGKWVFCNGTDRQVTYGHCDSETELTQRADSLKKKNINAYNPYSREIQSLPPLAGVKE